MPTKAAPSKKSSKKTSTAPYVTLREIEWACPCADEYYSFLADFDAQPVDKDRYDQRDESKKSKLGPDDHILLSSISTTESSSMDSYSRLQWLVEHVVIQPVEASEILRRLFQDYSKEALIAIIAHCVDLKVLRKVLDKF